MVLTRWAMLSAAALAGAVLAQGLPGSPGGIGGPRGSSGPGGAAPGLNIPDEASPGSSSQKPDVAAQKAFRQGMKFLEKARGYEAAAESASSPEKKAREADKVGDAYDRALDAFTEALSNKSDMVEAWDHVGFVHLRLGAYRESIDDYDHALALRPSLSDATERRAEACLAVDRLTDVKSAYMDLYNHAPDLASRLMNAMRQWVSEHQAEPRGMRPADVISFASWVSERDGIAKQASALPQQP